MIRYFCKKCNAESASPVCSRCGRKLPAGMMRDVWRVWRVPLSDGGTWLGALKVTFLLAALLFLLVFGAEALLSGTDRVMALLSSGLPGVICALIPVSLLLTLLFLALQGREILVYALDVQGAHVQVWHAASRIRCWARLQSARLEEAVPQQDGGALLLSQVRHMLWKDVRQVRYAPRKGEIRLYHTPRLAPMVLRLPAEEYETAEALVKKYCKGIA